MDEYHSNCVTETSYRRLSHQIFGEDTHLKFYKGPFVDINRKSTDHILPSVPVSKRISRKKNPSSKNIRNFKRCLICYSDITQMKLSDDEVKKGSIEEVIEFFRILRSPMSNSNLNLYVPDDYNTLLEQSVKQLATTTTCLCVTCGAACQKFLKVHRTVRKLEQEVMELQVKFLNAIKLSKAISEKYEKEIGKLNQDEDEERNASKMTRGDHLTAVVNEIRTYLIGGKDVWSSMKDKWMNYVHLSMEDAPKSGQLHKLRKNTKTKQPKKTKQTKLESQVAFGNSLVKVIKVEKNDMLSPMDIGNDSLGLGPLPEGIERSDSPFDDNYDVVEDSTNSALDSVEHGQIIEEKPNIGSNEISFDNRKQSNDGPVHPSSLVHKLPPGKPISRQVLSYRRRRAQHANLSAKEFLQHQHHKNLPPGRLRRSIEELKATSKHPYYIKWRQTFGMTMSRPAYLKMRRELALKRQKILDEGGPLVSGPKDGCVLPVRWIEKDGKLTYLGLEVNKHEDAMISCALCPDFKTKYRQTMSLHIKRDHVEGSKNIGCEQCDAKFLRPYDLRRHLLWNHKEGTKGKNLPASTGPSRAIVQLKKKSKNRYSIRWVEKDGKLTYLGFVVNKHEDTSMSCSLCPRYSTKSKINMSCHIRRNHIGVKSINCGQCDEKFIRPCDLKNHILKKHEGRTKLKNLPPGRMRRPIEELKTDRQNLNYIKWRQSHHGMTMSIPAYKKMRRELALKRQKIVDEGGVFMPEINGSRVPVRWIEKGGKLTYLGVEVKKHEDGTFSCSLCPDWNFPPCTKRRSLGYHIKKYHIEVAKNYACKQCDAKFYRKSELKVHEKEKHEGGYQCDTCGMVLSNRSTLFFHVRIKHAGIKPHICEHCGKGFGTKKDMTIHVRRHTGERPFVCHVCADTFIEKQSMKKHIRTKHPGEPIEELKN